MIVSGYVSAATQRGGAVARIVRIVPPRPFLMGKPGCGAIQGLHLPVVTG